MDWLIALNPGWHLQGTLFVVTDRDDARDVLGSGDAFLQWDGATVAGDEAPLTAAPVELPVSRRQPTASSGPYVLVDTPLFIDGEAHARFRDLLVKSWQAPRTAREMRPWAAALADRMIGEKQGAGPFEFMADVALPLASRTIATFFGDRPQLWLDLARHHPAIWGWNGNVEYGTRLLAALQVQIWRAVAERYADPRKDAISRMIHTRDAAGDSLRAEEIQTLLLEMAFVSTEATTRLLGSVAAALAENKRCLVSARDTSPNCLVTEALARRQPLQGVFRRTANEVVWKGTVLPANSGVFISIRAANAALAEAAGNDHRMLRRHLTFGAGSHTCPGATLAVMLAEVVAQALNVHGPIQLATSGCVNNWGGLLYGPKELWMEVNR